MTDRNWLSALSAQLNWGKDASWRNPSPIRSEADKPLREQVLDYDRAIKVDSQGLMLGDYRVKPYRLNACLSGSGLVMPQVLRAI